VRPDEIISTPGDYRSPLFAGGAWRVLAVQLGSSNGWWRYYARQWPRGRADDAVNAPVLPGVDAREAARLSGRHALRCWPRTDNFRRAK
jgi:hypothetical protein